MVIKLDYRIRIIYRLDHARSPSWLTFSDTKYWRGICLRQPGTLHWWSLAATNLLVTGRLPWQPDSIKFTQCVSGQKSAFSPPAGKAMRWIDKWLTPFRIVTTFSISMQSLGEIELRAPAVGAKIGVFCMSRTLGLPAHGDIIQTNIVWAFIGWFWCGFQCFFRMDCSFRCTT